MGEVVQRCVERVQELDDRGVLTWGIVYGGTLEVLVDDEQHPTGLIDWAGVGRSPLLLDAAVVLVEMDRHQSLSGTRQDRFLRAYSEAGPLAAAELVEVRAMIDLRWAAAAKWWAQRCRDGLTLGSPDAEENERGLADTAAYFAGRGFL